MACGIGVVLTRWLGEHDEAASIIDSLMTDPSSAFPQDVAWLVAHSVLSEAISVSRARRTRPPREYRVLDPYGGRVPAMGNVTRPSVTLALATLAARAGWEEQAEQRFAEAVELHRQLGATGRLARTQLNGLASSSRGVMRIGARCAVGRGHGRCRPDRCRGCPPSNPGIGCRGCSNGSTRSAEA